VERIIKHPDFKTRLTFVLISFVCLVVFLGLYFLIEAGLLRSLSGFIGFVSFMLLLYHFPKLFYPERAGTIRGPIGLKTKIILSGLSIVMLLAGYWHLANKQHKINPNDRTIPTYGQLWEGVQKAVELNGMSEERWVVIDSIATFKRLFLGLGISIVVSVFLGLLMGCFKTVESFCILPLSFLAKIPPTASMAIFFVMFGMDTRMFVTVIGFGLIPIFSQSVYLAVKDVPEENLFKSATLGASVGEQIWIVVFRQITPKILDTVRLQIGPAVVYLIAAEMMCADVGIGYRIRMFYKLSDMTVVYPYLFLLAGFGFVMDMGLKYLTRVWCPWYSERS